jgi:DnaJ-class molecular chaperone
MELPCEVCHGSGQRCYFKGESRFLLSWQDCSACGGTGYVNDLAERVRKATGEATRADVTSADDRRLPPS